MNEKINPLFEQVVLRSEVLGLQSWINKKGELKPGRIEFQSTGFPDRLAAWDNSGHMVTEDCARILA